MAEISQFAAIVRLIRRDVEQTAFKHALGAVNQRERLCGVGLHERSKECVLPASLHSFIPQLSI